MVARTQAGWFARHRDDGAGVSHRACADLEGNGVGAFGVKRLSLRLAMDGAGRLAAVWPRPRIGWSTVALSLIWPAVWLAYTFVHGALSGWYPYPFLNVAKIGYPAALANTVAVLGGAGVLVLLFKGLDRWVPAPLSSMRRERGAAIGRI